MKYDARGQSTVNRAHRTAECVEHIQTVQFEAEAVQSCQLPKAKPHERLFVYGEDHEIINDETINLGVESIDPDE